MNSENRPSSRSPNTAVRNAHTKTSYGSNIRQVKVLLIAGFAALAGGVLVAHSTPAVGYELSIYKATPLLFWAGASIATVISLLVCFLPAGVEGRGRHGWVRLSALSLGAVSVLSILSIPIIRGYYFIGSADSLTHLGWAKDLVAGRLDAIDILYPAMHLLAVEIRELVGVELTLAFQYVMLAFAVAFFLFVPLCLLQIYPSRWALPVGLFCAALLVPINGISVFYVPYPTTMAIFLTPLILFVLLRYVRKPTDAPVTRFGAVLASLSVAIILIHPQQAVNVLGVFCAVYAVQLLARRWRPDGPIAQHRSLSIQTLWFGGVFTVWSLTQERVFDAAVSILTGIFEAGLAGDEVAQRGDSLAELGGGIAILFVKLFWPGMIVAALTGLFVLASITGRLDDLPDRNAAGKYLSAALVPLLGLFGVMVASSLTVQYFRQVGFIMVVGTILASAAICLGLDLMTWPEVRSQLSSRKEAACSTDAGSGSRPQLLTDRLPSRSALATVVIAFALLLPMSLLTVYASPWTYQASAGVTDNHLEGYETLFEHDSPSIPLTGLRNGPIREYHAIQGTAPFGADRAPGTRTGINDTLFETDLTRQFSEPRYIAFGANDYATEVRLYDGFRYGERGFRNLRTTPGIHHVQTNGDVEVYLVMSNESATNATTGNRVTTKRGRMPISAPQQSPSDIRPISVLRPVFVYEQIATIRRPTAEQKS